MRKGVLYLYAIMFLTVAYGIVEEAEENILIYLLELWKNEHLNYNEILVVVFMICTAYSYIVF